MIEQWALLTKTFDNSTGFPWKHGNHSYFIMCTSEERYFLSFADSLSQKPSKTGNHQSVFVSHELDE